MPVAELSSMVEDERTPPASGTSSVRSNVQIAVHKMSNAVAPAPASNLPPELQQGAAGSSEISKSQSQNTLFPPSQTGSVTSSAEVGGLGGSGTTTPSSPKVDVFRKRSNNISLIRQSIVATDGVVPLPQQEALRRDLMITDRSPSQQGAPTAGEVDFDYEEAAEPGTIEAGGEVTQFPAVEGGEQATNPLSSQVFYPGRHGNAIVTRTSILMRTVVTHRVTQAFAFVALLWTLLGPPALRYAGGKDSDAVLMAVSGVMLGVLVVEFVLNALGERTMFLNDVKGVMHLCVILVAVARLLQVERSFGTTGRAIGVVLQLLPTARVAAVLTKVYAGFRQRIALNATTDTDNTMIINQMYALILKKLNCLIFFKVTLVICVILLLYAIVTTAVGCRAGADYEDQERAFTLFLAGAYPLRTFHALVPNALQVAFSHPNGSYFVEALGGAGAAALAAGLGVGGDDELREVDVWESRTLGAQVAVAAGNGSTAWVPVTGRIWLDQGGLIDDAALWDLVFAGTALVVLTALNILIMMFARRLLIVIQMAFGSAGANLVYETIFEGNEEAAMVVGMKMNAIFLFCDIRRFTDVTESLKAEVMLFVNKIASIVHSAVSSFGGYPNKNVGDAFLCVWKLNQHDSKGEVADGALLSLLFILDAIEASTTLKKLTARVRERMADYEVRMGFGLHVGWGIEGAIGSRLKVDASYLSAHVNISARLEELTKSYQVDILLSGQVYSLLSAEYQTVCINIDIVSVKGSQQPIYLYTINPKLTGPTGRPGLCVLDNGPSAEARQFRAEFEGAVESYMVGNWAVAREVFERNSWYGPTAMILDFMSTHDFQAPADWRGFRQLTKK